MSLKAKAVGSVFTPVAWPPAWARRVEAPRHLRMAVSASVLSEGCSFLSLRGCEESL